MSILVNGSPTEEIIIKCGLKQGDPLAPFLFLLVAEGLGGLMRRAVEINRFKGFRDRIFAWLGLHFALPHSIYSLLNFVAASPVNTQVRKGLILI
jgi:hypothetical protein